MNKKSKQLTFEKHSAFKDFKSRVAHGGELSKGKRKLPRPIDLSKHIHLVLRSQCAKGPKSFLRSKNQNLVDRLVYKYAQKFNVKIVEVGNAGNHLHILLRASARAEFMNFLRTVSAQIALKITDTCKAKGLGRRFWDGLAYTKIVGWGKQLEIVKRYILLNRLEGAGAIPYGFRDFIKHLKSRDDLAWALGYVDVQSSA